ncbi:MAG TPA: homoserine O-succinyltransferase [Sphingomicrobium sp.]|jgi:homoserine O-acetyltransferase
MSLTDRCSAGPGPLCARRGEIALELQLRRGGDAAITLRYELIGNGTRLLLAGGGISAGRHVVASAEFPQPGWWEAQASSFDLADYRLLAIDWLGSDGALDLPIDAADQADAMAVLLDHLEIDAAHAFIGASYGGMVALQFAARHPTRCAAILVVSAAADSHPFSSACRSLQRRAVELAEANGDPAAGVALARAMAMLTYRTPAEFAERFGATPRVEAGRVRVGADDYLDHHGRRHVERMSATAYRRLSESIDLHRIDPAEIRTIASVAAVDSDSLVPRQDVEALAAAIPSARFQLIHSRFGHDAFLKEQGQVGAIITDFLQSLETKP